MAQPVGDLRFRELFEEQMRIAEHLGPAARLSALTTHAMHLTMSGYVAEADRTIAKAEEVRDLLGGAALREALDVALTLNDWAAGRWDDALERARWRGVAPQTAEMWASLAQCAEMAILVARGEVAAARAMADQLATATMAVSSASCGRALFHTMVGETEVAIRLLEDAWADDRRTGRLAPAHTLLSALIDIAMAQDDLETARRWLATLREVREEVPYPWMLTVSDRCLAAVTLDVEAGRRALSIALEHGMVLEAAHARLTLGELGDEPAVHLVAAFDAYKAMGAESFRRRTTHAMKAAGVATPRARRRKGGELTDTEVQLCKLVCDGLTNREIAGVLIISPKTVEVYLSRLFVKVGVKSRVELAVAVSDGRIQLS